MFGTILKLVMGSNLQGGSVRATYIVLLGLGWALGDRYGVPGIAQPLVDSAFDMVTNGLNGVLPGGDTPAE